MTKICFFVSCFSTSVSRLINLGLDQLIFQLPIIALVRFRGKQNVGSGTGKVMRILMLRIRHTLFYLSAALKSINHFFLFVFYLQFDLYRFSL